MKSLITGDEILRLTEYSSITKDIETVNDIVSEWRNKGYICGNPNFDNICMLIAIFQAGEIQGKRKERSRRSSTREGAPV